MDFYEAREASSPETKPHSSVEGVLFGLSDVVPRRKQHLNDCDYNGLGNVFKPPVSHTSNKGRRIPDLRYAERRARPSRHIKRASNLAQRFLPTSKPADVLLSDRRAEIRHPGQKQQDAGEHL